MSDTRDLDGKLIDALEDQQVNPDHRPMKIPGPSLEVRSAVSRKGPDIRDAVEQERIEKYGTDMDGNVVDEVAYGHYMNGTGIWGPVSPDWGFGPKTEAALKEWGRASSGQAEEPQSEKFLRAYQEGFEAGFRRGVWAGEMDK